MIPKSRTNGHMLTEDEIEDQDRRDIQAEIHQLKKDIPALIRQAIKEEWNAQLLQLQPLAHAARLIGISPTTAHGYKKAGLLNNKVDGFGKIIPKDLLTVHLSQRTCQ